MSYFQNEGKCLKISFSRDPPRSNDYNIVISLHFLHEDILKELEWFFKGSFYNWLEVEVHNGHLNIVQHF